MKYQVFKAGQITAFVVTAMALVAPSGVEAAFQVRLQQSGFADQTFNDNNNDGIISGNTDFGDFQIRGSFNQTNSPGGVNAFLFDDTTTITNTANGDRTLRFLLSANDFTSPAGPAYNGNASATGQIAPQSTGDTAGVSYEFYGSDSNTPLFLLDQLIASGSFSLAGSGDVESLQTTGSFTATPTFQLTYLVDLTLGANTVINFDGQGQVTAVPEPATLAAALTALPLLGGLYLRRRAKKRA